MSLSAFWEEFQEAAEDDKRAEMQRKAQTLKRYKKYG